jgi:hypothetical protein
MSNHERSQDSSSADDSKQDDHDGDYQKNVNETAHGVGGDHPQEPQYNQNNSDSVKHNKYPFLFRVQCSVQTALFYMPTRNSLSLPKQLDFSSSFFLRMPFL